MSVIKKRLAELMNENNVSNADVSRHTGIGKSSITAYLNGNYEPKQKALYSLAKFFDVSEAYLLGLSDSKKYIVDTNNGIVGDNSGTVNITNNNVDTSDVEETQATALVTQKEILSNGTDVTDTLKEILSYQKKIYNFLTNKPKPDNTVSEELYEYNLIHRLSAGLGDGTDVPMDYLDYDVVYHDKNIDYDIASYITGDSMEPTYKDGEVALIKKTGFDYDGGIYAVVWDGQTYIKRVYREEKHLRLVSLNTKYSDKIAPFEEEPRVVGLVVGHFMPIYN